MDTTNIRTALLSAGNWPDFEAIFGPTTGCNGCWCYNHHIPPGAPDVAGPDACEAKRVLVSQGGAGGIVAYLDGRPTGW